MMIKRNAADRRLCRRQLRFPLFRGESNEEISHRTTSVDIYPLLIFIAVISVRHVHGALIETDWKNPGDKLLTHDSTTGLFWLDVTESRNRPKTDVLTEFGAGGDFEGFRYATPIEIGAFWNNAGVTGHATTEGANNTVNDAFSLALMDMWSFTKNDGVLREVLAVTSETNSGNASLANVARIAHLFSSPTTWGGTRWNIVNNGGFSNGEGHALVTSVPEPTALVLSVLGLLSLSMTRRHRRKRFA